MEVKAAMFGKSTAAILPIWKQEPPCAEKNCKFSSDKNKEVKTAMFREEK